MRSTPKHLFGILCTAALCACGEGEVSQTSATTGELTVHDESTSSDELVTGEMTGGPDSSGASSVGDASSGSVAEEPGLALYGDADRDGMLTPSDRELATNPWSWEGPGALVLANLDDDDQDGLRDAEDASVTGEADAADLARFRLEVTALAPDLSVELAFTGEQADTCTAALRVFVGPGWTPLNGPVPVVDGALELGVEASRFAGPDWPGRCTLSASGGGFTASTELRVAPWLALTNAAATEVLYVASGAYPNQAFLSGLADVSTELAALGRAITLVEHPTALWRDMWMQDTMEIGYTEIPGPGGVQRMHVVLRANRGPNADEFPPTLLAPGVGYLQLGEFRGLVDGDEWADWFGNLEVSPPLPAYPLGRVYYGHNTLTDTTLHPAIVDFIAAQELQAPFAVDTSWLSIKHVDEIFNFLPGPDQSPRLIVVSPRAAASVQALDAYNSALQDKIDATVAAALDELGLDPWQVIELPVAFRPGDLGALNLWSNPVNAVFLNGLVILGDTDESDPNMLVPLSPALKDLLSDAYAEADAYPLRFLDDSSYQTRWGNVHCATNTLRVPLTSRFW